MITATKTLAAALFLATVIPMAFTALAGPPAEMHSLTGAGFVVVPADYFFPGSPAWTSWSTIEAHLKPDGTVQGTSMLHLWFESSPNPINLVTDITCLTVDGNTAYFSGVLTSSSDLSYAKPGDEEVGFVTDTNGDGPDFFWSGPSVFFLPPGADCTAKPAMLQYRLTSGNFIVR
jgi:hypothetical protein